MHEKHPFNSCWRFSNLLQHFTCNSANYKCSTERYVLLILNVRCKIFFKIDDRDKPIVPLVSPTKLLPQYRKRANTLSVISESPPTHNEVGHDEEHDANPRHAVLPLRRQSFDLRTKRDVMMASSFVRRKSFEESMESQAIKIGMQNGMLSCFGNDIDY